MLIETVEVSIFEEAGSADRAIRRVKRSNQPARNHYYVAIDGPKGWEGEGRGILFFLTVNKKL
jgi:hypothetical protein